MGAPHCGWATPWRIIGQSDRGYLVDESSSHFYEINIWLKPPTSNQHGIKNEWRIPDGIAATGISNESQEELHGEKEKEDVFDHEEALRGIWGWLSIELDVDGDPNCI